MFSDRIILGAQLIIGSWISSSSAVYMMLITLENVFFHQVFWYKP